MSENNKAISPDEGIEQQLQKGGVLMYCEQCGLQAVAPADTIIAKTAKAMNPNAVKNIAVVFTVCEEHLDIGLEKAGDSYD